MAETGRITRAWECPCGHCTFTAEFIEGDLLVVTEKVDGRKCLYTQYVRPADWAHDIGLLDDGACPVCDGWEDGDGNPVRPSVHGWEVEE